MKERRHAGATHSFRLTMKAAEIVDNINHPRRLGGKSRKISDAIEWYFSPRGTQPSYEELLQNISKLVGRLESGENMEQISSASQIADEKAQKVSKVRGIRRIFHWIRSFHL